MFWGRSPHLCALAVAAAISLAATPAAAHPHVWIETNSDVVFDEAGRIVAINVEWQFDEMYSAVAVEGLDANGNGLYEPEELQPMAAENIAALKDYDYFTYVKADGKKVPYDEVTEFGQLHKDGYLTMYFTVPLAEPVDPRTAEVAYTIHDPTFFISIELAPKAPVRVVGAAPEPCRIDIRESAAESDDFQYSEEFWSQNDAAEGMGAMFARPIAVTCKPKTAAR